MDTIIEALDKGLTLITTYDGKRRQIEPLQYGLSTAGNPVLRAIDKGVPKLFYINELSNNELGIPFTPTSHYGTDEGMTTVISVVNPESVLHTPEYDNDLTRIKQRLEVTNQDSPFASVGWSLF
jgi:hypothetical protein